MEGKKNMKKQRIGAIVLAGAMLLSMTGCGNSKANAYKKYVELGEYKGIEYTMNVAEVTDDDVQAKVDSFLNGLAETTEVTDRAVENGDIVNIDFVGSKDGVEFDGGTGTGYDLTIGSNTFIDGFESGLIGANKGDEVSLDLTFPEDYQEADLAGQEVNFMVTINTISVKTAPELTDALVKEKTEYDSVDAYKKSIREDLEAQNKKTAESDADTYIFTQVMNNSKITGYDEAELKELIDMTFDNFEQTAASYSSYGYTYEDVLAMSGYETEEQLKEGITEYAKNYLAQRMIVYVIAAKEGIKATQEEKDEIIQQYKDILGVETDEQVYKQAGIGEEYLELTVLSENVSEFLRENGVLVDSLEETTEASTTEAE